MIDELKINWLIIFNKKVEIFPFSFFYKKNDTI